MKFSKLRVNNWRSFYGQQEIEFSTDGERPVTLILGSNGAGKTALLNAFTWVIFGEFTEGFSRTQDLINHEALGIDPRDCAEVELLLQDSGREYRIRRTVNPTQQLSGANEVFVSVDGKIDTEEAVHQLLPRALMDLLFFPAESFSTAKVHRASGESSSSAGLRIDHAIQTMLGGDIYDNAVADLQAAAKSGALKAKRGVSQEDHLAAQSTFDQALAEYADGKNLIRELPDRIERARVAAAQAEEAAKQFDPDRIQEFKDTLHAKETAIALARADQEEANALYLQLAKVAHGVFSSKAIGSAISRLEYAEKCGIIPPRIDQSVLDHSLKTGRCALCDDELGPDGVVRVQTLLERVADSRTAVKAIEARTTLRGYQVRSEKKLAELRIRASGLADRFENVPSPVGDASLVHIRATITECGTLARRQRERCELDMETYIDEAPDEPSENVVSVSIAREKSLVELESQFRNAQDRIPLLKAAHDKALSELEAKSKGSKESEDRIRAIRLIEEAREFFEEANAGLAEFGRQDFERAINEAYSDLVRKPYTLRVDSGFKIELLEAGTEQAVAASQAENVLLLIAFLGAMARLAPKYHQIRSERAQFKKVGGVETSSGEGFPVVIDAPTSALDEQYEEEVIKALPRLLPQIIIPVSAKSVEKWEHSSESIGKVYIMELASKGQSNRHIRWGGQDHVYSKRDDSVGTRTRIVSIN